MALVNTPSRHLRAADDRPTSYEEFLDVLAGLRLSSSRIDIDIDRGLVTLDGRDAGLSAKEHDLLPTWPPTPTAPSPAKNSSPRCGPTPSWAPNRAPWTPTFAACVRSLKSCPT